MLSRIRTPILVLAAMLGALAVGAAPAEAATGYAGGISSAYQHRDGSTDVRGWVYDRAQPSKSVWMCVWSASACRRWVRADLAGPDGRGSHWFHAKLWRAETGTRTSLRHTPASVVSSLSVSTPGERIVSVARAQVGARYVWGGSSPSGFDCSGLTMYAYRRGGVASLPHQTDAQRAAPYMRRIARSAARPGDLIFYLGGGSSYHVAIYAGGTKQFAATTPGEGVKYQDIWSTQTEFRTDWH